MSDPLSPLRLNVGFIVHQTIGYCREFDFDIPQIIVKPDLQLKNLSGVVRVTRTPQGLLLQAKMHAEVQADCVRCLSALQQPLKPDFSELYAFNRKSVTESGLILPEDGHIDLEPILREYMILEMPITPLCRMDCKGLCPVCGNNLNEKDCGHQPDSGDPRLDILKTMLL